MKKIIALAACLALTGCSLWPAKSAAEANLKNWRVVGPAYVKYLEADESVSADSKKIRKQTVADAVALAEKMVESAR